MISEQELSERGICIDAVQHRGSYYGMYWGYVVVENGWDDTIYHGRSSHKNYKSPDDAFLSRSKALAFAQTLAGEKEVQEEEHKVDLDCPWTEIGGEG